MAEYDSANSGVSRGTRALPRTEVFGEARLSSCDKGLTTVVTGKSQTSGPVGGPSHLTTARATSRRGAAFEGIGSHRVLTRAGASAEVVVSARSSIAAFMAEGKYRPSPEGLAGKVFSRCPRVGVSIALLLRRRGPTTIGRFVVPVVVDPVKTVPVPRTIAHINIKSREVVPPLTNGDPPSTVARILLMLWVAAALAHRGPRPVFHGLVRTMRDVHGQTITTAAMEINHARV